MGLGFSVAGGVDQNKPVTVREQPFLPLPRVVVASLIARCVLFPGSQGVRLRCSSPGGLHTRRGHRPVHQRHVPVRLRPLGGPEGPEKSQDSESGGGGPEEGRSR